MRALGRRCNRVRGLVRGSGKNMEGWVGLRFLTMLWVNDERYTNIQVYIHENYSHFFPLVLDETWMWQRRWAISKRHSDDIIGGLFSLSLRGFHGNWCWCAHRLVVAVAVAEKRGISMQTPGICHLREKERRFSRRITLQKIHQKDIRVVLFSLLLSSFRLFWLSFCFFWGLLEEGRRGGEGGGGEEGWGDGGCSSMVLAFGGGLSFAGKKWERIGWFFLFSMGFSVCG